MGTSIAPRPWDLTHLQDFLPTYTPREIEATTPRATPSSTSENARHDDDRRTSTNDGLGDFSKIYNYLGTSTLSATDSGLVTIPVKDDYASDGAMYQTSTLARLQKSSPDLSDGMDGVEAVFAFDQADPATTLQSIGAKSQHKKERKKAKKESKKAAPQAQRATLSESECDSSFGRETPAKKAASHGMTTRSMSAKMQTDFATSSEQAIRAVAEAASRFKQDEALPDTPCPKRQVARVATPDTKSLPTPIEPARAAVAPAAPVAPHHASENVRHSIPKQQNGLSYGTKNNYLVPSSILPKKETGPPHNTKNTKVQEYVPSAVEPLTNSGNAEVPFQPTTPIRPFNTGSSSPRIEPITLRSGEDRELALFFKILQDFGADRKHLAKPSNLTTHNSDPAGIHVFVDASNIFIGFVDQLKRSRNIHPLQRVPDVNLSFDSLALLIERRRPVAKRVLVGSTPHIPAFDKAKDVGYEVSVLEKVMKARELTERQIYFKEVDALRSGRKSSKKPPPHKIALEGSVLTPGGSETITPPQPQYAPPRLVEQGVDEILHLKMMESMLDAEKPGIMVLATGDAAQAEYSSGFMAMVERALRKGWSVELTSWAKNVSSLYRHKAWTAAWGERFRIIELDSYAEELLDM